MLGGPRNGACSGAETGTLLPTEGMVTTAGPERRLAAIMFSDIVGYTALMAADEALRRWVAHDEPHDRHVYAASYGSHGSEQAKPPLRGIVR